VNGLAGRHVDVREEMAGRFAASASIGLFDYSMGDAASVRRDVSLPKMD